MKTLIWIVILAALFFGGYKLYQKISAKNETQTAAATTKTAANETKTATAAVKTPATERGVFPESYEGKPNSQKGIKNWRPVKKVTNLNDQHQKDLMDNM